MIDLQILPWFSHDASKPKGQLVLHAEDTILSSFTLSGMSKHRSETEPNS